MSRRHAFLNIKGLKGKRERFPFNKSFIKGGCTVKFDDVSMKKRKANFLTLLP